jgi:hypothetical protein
LMHSTRGYFCVLFSFLWNSKIFTWNNSKNEWLITKFLSKTSITKRFRLKKRYNNKFNKDGIRFISGLWIRVHSNPDTDPEQAKFINPDPETILIRKRFRKRVGIKRKGLIRIWIRIQMNTDPQPRYKPYPVYVDYIFDSIF